MPNSRKRSTASSAPSSPESVPVANRRQHFKRRQSMKAFPHFTRRWLPAVLAATALALATTARAQPTKIKVMVAPTAFEAVYIARDQGIFTKHNLEVEVLPGGAPDAMIPLLLNGQIQYA